MKAITQKIICNVLFLICLFTGSQHTYAEINGYPIAIYSSAADAVTKEKDLQSGFGEHYLKIEHPSTVVLNSLKAEYLGIKFSGGHNHELELEIKHDELGAEARDYLRLHLTRKVFNGVLHIEHAPIPAKYISDKPYTLSIKVLACNKLDCSNKDEIPTKIELYILAGQDAETFKAPNLSVDALFYIDRNNTPRIAGLEHVQDLATAVNKLTNIDINEIKSQIENQKATLGEAITGFVDVLSNDLTSVYDTAEQQELFQDQNLLEFLASKELDKVTDEDLNKLSEVINRHKDGLSSLKDSVPEVSFPKEKIDCKNNSECRAYLQLSGELMFEPKILAETGERRDGKKFAEFLVSAEDGNPFEVNLKATLGANYAFEKTKQNPWRSSRKQFISKKLVQIIPGPAGVPVVLSEKLSLYGQVEISGKLEAGGEVEFSYSKEEIFAAGVGFNGKDYYLNGHTYCTEQLGVKGFKAYRCRATKKDAFSIKGIIKGTAEAEAVLWIYPEIEFMVYRNAGANVSLEPGIYAKTKIEGEYTVETEIETIAENHEQYLDANYQFSNLELGVKARARFRADLGLIYKKAGEEKVAGLAYPLCVGVCSREERKVIEIGTYPLISLPKVTPAKRGSLGNELTLVAQIDNGKFFTQADGTNDINGHSWQLVGKAKNVLGLPPILLSQQFPVRAAQIEKKVQVVNPDALEAGETYTVRLVYWSEIHKIVRQTVDFNFTYNPPQGDPNLTYSTSTINTKLLWDDVESATEYQIYKDGVFLTAVAATGNPSYEYFDNDSNLGQSYTYQVLPVSEGGVQYGSPVLNVIAGNCLANCSAGRYSIGGTVTGLTGAGLVLQNNGGDDLAIAADGSFSFATALVDTSAYSVTVSSQPGSPSQTCTVSNSGGVVASAAVTNVAISCSLNNSSSYSIGGTVTGLTGTGLVLQNNGADDLAIAADGSFSFATALVDASAYSVTVSSQPGSPSQTCTVSNGGGAVASAAVTNVVVSCSTNNSSSYLIGGTVTGLTGTGLVLQNNGGDDLTIAADGSFSFATALVDASAYSVTVSSQPGSPSQTCTVSNSGGAVASAAVTNVAISCSSLNAPLTVTVSASQPKVLSFSWNDVGADHYKLLKNPDGSSGFSQVGADITTTNVDEIIAVHLQDWVNASYIVQACDVSDVCTDSAAITATTAMLDAIGYFKASNIGGNDRFGYSVALSADGKTLAVTTADAGVYLFSRSGSSWSQQAYINGGDGMSLALSADGNTLAVGDSYTDSPTGGAVYLFSRSGSSWSQQAYIKASNREAIDGFGGSVALSADGNTLAVGAIGEDSAATGINGDESNNSATTAGAVYLFTRSGSSWSQQAYIKASNTEAIDHFGYSVSLSGDGNTLAVGAFYEGSAATGINGDQSDNSATDAGAVYLFIRTGSSWSQQAYIKASNADASDNFGQVVALSADGNTLAVGAYGEGSAATGINGDEDDNNVAGAGAVYLFSRVSSSWSQQAYIKASNTGGFDRFGASVSLSADGNILAIGAEQEGSTATGINGDDIDYIQINSSGAVYLFSRSGSSWSQQAYIKASNTGEGDFFGTVSLSADGNTLAVGAHREGSAATGINGDQSDNSVTWAGAVYLY